MRRVEYSWQSSKWSRQPTPNPVPNLPVAAHHSINSHVMCPSRSTPAIREIIDPKPSAVGCSLGSMRSGLISVLLERSALQWRLRDINRLFFKT